MPPSAVLRAASLASILARMVITTRRLPTGSISRPTQVSSKVNLYSSPLGSRPSRTPVKLASHSLSLLRVTPTSSSCSVPPCIESIASLDCVSSTRQSTTTTTIFGRPRSPLEASSTPATSQSSLQPPTCRVPSTTSSTTALARSSATTTLANGPSLKGLAGRRVRTSLQVHPTTFLSSTWSQPSGARHPQRPSQASRLAPSRSRTLLSSVRGHQQPTRAFLLD